jgi:hypothetical protein
MCHLASQTSSNNNIMWSKKIMISYNLTHGITIMKKHVVNWHTPKLFNRLNYKSKGENNGRISSWGTLPSS